MSRGRYIPVQAIELACQKRAWSVTELAEAADISVATASRACAGRPITGPILLKLAVAFQRHPPNEAIEHLLEGKA